MAGSVYKLMNPCQPCRTRGRLVCDVTDPECLRYRAPSQNDRIVAREEADDERRIMSSKATVMDIQQPNSRQGLQEPKVEIDEQAELYRQYRHKLMEQQLASADTKRSKPSEDNGNSKRSDEQSKRSESARVPTVTGRGVDTQPAGFAGRSNGRNVTHIQRKQVLARESPRESSSANSMRE